MTQHSFHAHGPHEHALQHEAVQGSNLAQYVAIFTALLSAFAAVVSYHGAAVQNEAMLLKNDAVIKVSQAIDQWSFYQSKNNRVHLMELAAELVPAKTAYYQAQQQRYLQDKALIEQRAQALDAAFLADNAQSNRLIASHHQEAQGMMFLQIAIALASVTALTNKRWLFALAGLAAICGISLSIIAWVMV